MESTEASKVFVAAAKLLQSCLTLCDPIDGSPPGSAFPGILQARTLEWVAISFSNAWKWKMKSEVAQPCPTLSDPMDCSPPGSSFHGSFQARVLEWSAIAFSVPRSKNLLTSWLQSSSAVILEPPKIKSDTVSTVSLSICHEVMGPDAVILVLWDHWNKGRELP